ncbi:hypothetical protein MTO96_025283 [Rhipicephalus appendiculatus]
MADKAKTTPQKSASKSKSSKGQSAAKHHSLPASKAEGTAALGAEGFSSPDSNDRYIQSKITRRTLRKVLLKWRVRRTWSRHKSSVETNPLGTSKSAVVSTKLSKAAGKPKAKSSVANPAPDAGASKAKGTAARTTSDVPKDTGTVISGSDPKDTGAILPSLRQEVVHSAKPSPKVDDVSMVAECRGVQSCEWRRWKEPLVPEKSPKSSKAAGKNADVSRPGQ